MSASSWGRPLAVGAGLLIASGLCAADDVDTKKLIEQLQRQNEELAAKVAELDQRLDERDAEDDRWLTDARAAEIRGLVQDVLADADSRVSLAGDGATAGWDKGFFVGSADGTFRLNIRGLIQVRWAYDRRDIPSGPLAPGSGAPPENNWGWELRRTEIFFTGHVIDPTLTFFVKTIFNRSSGSTSGLPAGASVNFNNANGSVEEIYIQKTFGAWSIRAGQFKAPFNREELVSSGAQLAVERSMISETFTTKYAQGLQVGFEQDRFRIFGFYGDSMRADHVNPTTGAGQAGSFPGSLNTTYNTSETNYAFAGRAELLLAGTWSQFNDLNSFRGEEFGLLLGVAGMAQSLRPTATLAPSAAQEMWGVTADITVDFGGANLFAYGVYRGITLKSPTATRGGGMNDTLHQYGFVVQGGYFVVDDVELFVRYEYGDTDTDQYRTAPGALSADLARASVVTVGANWYPMGYQNRRLKFTTDLGYAFLPLGDFASSASDWLLDATPVNENSEDGQWLVRAQLQLMF